MTTTDKAEKPFDPARPRYTLDFAGKEYELLGTLELVEAVEYAFKEGIGQVAARSVSMGLTETAKLLATVLTACGHKAQPREVAETLFNEVGVRTDAFGLVQLRLYSFLNVLLEPPESRQRRAEEMGELIGKWTAPDASPGRRTRKSASAG